MVVKHWLKTTSRTLATFGNRNHPFFAHLYLTRRCNLRCRMCNVWKDPRPELDMKGVFKIVDKLDRLGVVLIQLTGGEPFLRKDIIEIIDYIKNKGLSVSVSTNGTLPLSVYKKLEGVSLDGIGVSLHSISPKTQEAINGVPGSWKKTIRTIKFLKEQGQKVYVCCVISSLNLHETPDIVKFCENELGVSIGLQPAVVGGNEGFIFRGKDEDLKNLDYDIVEKVLKKTRLFSMRRTRTFMKNAFKVIANKEVEWNCRAGRMFLAIMPDGQFGICQDILTDVNILDDDFFEKTKSKDFRKKIQKLVDSCPKCVYSCYYDITNVFAKPWEVLDMGMRLAFFNFLGFIRGKAFRASQS